MKGANVLVDRGSNLPNESERPVLVQCRTIPYLEEGRERRQAKRAQEKKEKAERKKTEGKGKKEKERKKEKEGKKTTFP